MTVGMSFKNEVERMLSEILDERYSLMRNNDPFPPSTLLCIESSCPYS